jgi:exosortase/archaeosortase family protein
MLSFRSGWKRGVLMASAVPLAVLGNVVRMLTIIVAAELWGQEAGAYVHEGGPFGIISLLPYAAAFAGLLLLGYMLREEPLKPVPPPAAEAP